MMSTSRARRSLHRALDELRAHIHEVGRPPSLREWARRCRVSPQRVCALAKELEGLGLVTHQPGVPFSYRPAGASPASLLSDRDLIQEVRSRFIGIGRALRQAIPAKPLTQMELPEDRALQHLLDQLGDPSPGAGMSRGEGEAQDQGEGDVAGGAGREEGSGAVPRDRGDGRDRRAA